MIETKYKIRATIPSNLVKEMERVFGMIHTKDDMGNVSGVWNVSKNDLHKTIDILNSMGIHELMIEESGVHFYVAISQKLLVDLQNILSPYISGIFTRQEDPFSDGEVLSFFVSAQYAATIRQRLEEHGIIRYVGLVSFIILKDKPNA